MKRKLTLMLAAATIALLLSAPRAFGYTIAPQPPHVGLVATPLSQLHLGMSAQQVARIMGEPAKTSRFPMARAETCKLEFSGPIPGKVMLTDGKVSRVALDVFQPDKGKGDLPAFVRPAWPGMAESAVRRVLGEARDIRHHVFSGIDVDQWLYSRGDQSDVSVFFRAGHVIARAIGQSVPPDLFRVDLPAPPEAEGEDPVSAARAGMTTDDIEALYGPIKFRVDTIVNGEPVSRIVFQLPNAGTFAGFTFVDGVVTEFEDLGRMPVDPAFQGR